MHTTANILLITPPFTQLNTPYPATAYLKGFLQTKEINAAQCDLGIETILEIFSEKGLRTIFPSKISPHFSENSKLIFSLREEYFTTVHSVIRFLQNEDPTLAYRIAERNLLPEASRFSQLDDLDWAFGNIGIQDKAKYIATLYLEDIGDFITENIDPNFGFSRYAERFGRSALEFDEIYFKLKEKHTTIEEIFLSLLKSKISLFQQLKLVCFSVPFPGNLFSAFRCAQWIKKHFPNIKTAMGGGFPNTELRSLTEKRVFDYFDFITLDDGERPLLNLTEHLNGKRNAGQLTRTFLLESNSVIYKNYPDPDFSLRETGTPSYEGLPLKKYLSVIEIANPMHRLWSDGRWNKLTLAHGCYWGKCTFCDISLDYIGRYEPANASMICDRMQEMILATGETGFHFVDEAAPPSLMRELALEILRRGMKVSWWTNIRFEKSFTRNLCRLLAASGCIAVSGGLEVASDRLLELIEKGVTVKQVARVTSGFTDAGIMVHAYLMYGYPTQTIQETVDSLEMVRQLFEEGIIQSGFWHRFALTAHSPVGLNPGKYKIDILTTQKGKFANNDLEFIDRTEIDHELFSDGLRKSLFNYMHGIGFDFPLQEWFDFSVPKTKVKKDFISSAIEAIEEDKLKEYHKLVWTGGKTEFEHGKTKSEVIIYNRSGITKFKMKSDIARWIEKRLNEEWLPGKSILIKDISASMMKETGNPFVLFYYDDAFKQWNEAGLLVV